MRKSVSKLTATTLKRIIAEEKQKLKKAGLIKEEKKVISASQKRAIILKLKAIQEKKLNEAKKIEAIKRKIRKALNKKGE
jgi:hypothetical protein